MRKGSIVACLIVLALGGVAALAADAPEAKVDTALPPFVVTALPANRATDVDPALQAIKVTFDRPMQTEKSWSWVLHTALGAYPGYRGSAEPRWEDGGRTCVLPVRLKPDTVYAVGANSFRHTGFRDEGGKAAVPHVWVFKTRKAG